MRRFFKKAARALRARRELVTAAAVTIVAAMLTAGGQGNLAAAVAVGAAGFMAGRTCKYRLAAQSLRRQVAELGDELSDNEMNVSLLSRLAQEREEDLSWLEGQARLSLADGRKAIGEYSVFLKREGTSSHLPLLFSEALREWARDLDGLETVINNVGKELAGEQTQLADLLSPEEIDELYAGTDEVEDEDEEVNTDAAEE